MDRDLIFLFTNVEIIRSFKLSLIICEQIFKYIVHLIVNPLENVCAPALYGGEVTHFFVTKELSVREIKDIQILLVMLQLLTFL